MKDHPEYTWQLTQNAIDAQKTFDRGLLTLSAGEIVLSVTVITGLEEVTYKTLLLLAWSLLFLSLISQLASHLLSVKGHDKAIEGAVGQSKIYNKYIEYINIISLLLFIAGSIIFLWFIINNV